MIRLRTSPGSSSARSTTSRSAASTASPGAPSPCSRRLAPMRSTLPRVSAQVMTELRSRFPADLEFAVHARHHARGLGGHPRDPDHARRGDGARRPGRLPLPPELARHADPGRRRAGVAHRHVHRVPGARLLGQHALAASVSSSPSASSSTMRSSWWRRWSITSKKAWRRAMPRSRRWRRSRARS